MAITFRGIDGEGLTQLTNLLKIQIHLMNLKMLILLPDLLILKTLRNIHEDL